MPENNANIDQAFGDFIDQMMEEKRLLMGKQIPQPTREELNARLDDAIQRSVLEALPSDKLAELSQMLDREISDDELERFFDAAGVNYEQAVALAIDSFRQEYLREGLNTNTNNSTTTDTNTSASNLADQPAMGEPAQGTTSAVPGASDVEGVAMTTTEEVQ